MSKKESKPIGPVKATLGGLFFLVLVIGGCSAALSGGDNSGDDQLVAESTEPIVDEPTTQPTQDDDAKARKTAKKVEKRLAAVGLSCKWKEESGAVVHISTCEKHDLMIASGDEASVKVWVDGMNDEMKRKPPYPWALVHPQFAVVSSDQGTINRAWDGMGATGERWQLGTED